MLVAAFIAAVQAVFAQTAGLADEVVQGVHLAAHNNLTLPACHDQLDHALGFAQRLLIHLGFIL